MDRIDKIKQMLITMPGDSFLQHALALEHIKTGNDHAALELFTQLLADNENYVGSYYHLAKLYERRDETDAAIAVYEKGMAIAKAAGDNHAYNELRSSYEELTF